jgi:hypothetical protein
MSRIARRDGRGRGRLVLFAAEWGEGRARMVSSWTTRAAIMPVAAGLLLGLAAGSALAGGTLRIAMTASDVPTTTGAPDNGYEGMRFLGYPVFEGLVLWDLTSADKLADIRPGLAERWEQDAADKTKWVFHLRKGVKFPDGSEFNADAAIWNLDRSYKKDAKQFDPPGGAVAQARNPLRRWLSKDRRLYDRDRQSPSAQLLPQHAALHALLEPCTVREGWLVGRVRQDPLGHRGLQDYGVQAAGECHAQPQ